MKAPDHRHIASSARFGNLRCILTALQFGAVFQQYEFVRDGTGNPRVWQRQLNGLRWQLQQPGIQQWWREWGAITHEEEFRDFVDDLIREGEAAG
jgi:hypothetical protein